MNYRFLVLVLFVVFLSCDKKDTFPELCEIDNNSASKIFSKQIKFEISEHILAGKKVKQIELISNGYYYSVGKEIFLGNRNNRVSSSFQAESDILALAYDENNKTLYLGTNKSGFGKLEGDEITYFTVENSGLPRNLISRVECDCNGNVWFSSSAHQLGGLIKYNGSRFQKYLPEDSHLPDNLIHEIEIKNGKMYIVSGNPNKTGTIITEIEGNNWTELFQSGGCSMGDLDIDSDGNIFYIDDSREYCGGGLFPDEVVFSFSNNQKTILREHEDIWHFPYLMKIDKRNYVWVAKFSSNQHGILSVFDGENWQEAPEEFPNSFIHCIEVDDDNNIWLGTNNGIYILNQ
jgi:ligand-binding sensor domain-containing protein